MALSKFDTFFLKKYDKKEYNCMHFLVEVWKELFNIDVSFLLPAIVVGEKGMHEVISMDALKHFRRVKEPKTPGLCILHSASPEDTHVATFIDGRFFHITEDGVQFLPREIVSLGFPRMVCYEYIDNN